MLYGSRISKKKVYHYSSCRYYIGRMKAENTREFQSEEEAKDNGYLPCSCCNPIYAEYKRHQKKIEKYCEENGLRVSLENEEMQVISWDDTAWRVCMKGDGTTKKILFHESKKNPHYNRHTTAYINRTYHLQKVCRKDVRSYLMYIRRHDIDEEQRLIQRKKEKERIREQVNNIRMVQTQIYKQKQKRKKKGFMESNSAKRRRNKQNLRNIAHAFHDYKAAAAALI